LILHASDREIALALHDRFNDAIDRLPAMFDVAQQVTAERILLLDEDSGSPFVTPCAASAGSSGLIAQTRTAVIGK
jgi:hypothetical protein